MSQEEKKKEICENDLLPIAERSESARTEAERGMPGLVSDRKQLIEFLKQGGRSGISFDFGKPSFVDSGGDKDPAKAEQIEAAAEDKDLRADNAKEPEETIKNDSETGSGRPDGTCHKYRVRKRKEDLGYSLPLVQVQYALNRTISETEPAQLVSSAKVDRRYVLGVEVALAAIIASAGVARRRSEKAGVAARTLAESQAEPIVSESGEEQDDHEDTGDEKSKAAESADSAVIQKDKTAKVRRTITHRPTVIVSARDTLTGIAEAHFHDPAIGWLIADLNKHNIKESKVEGKRVVELVARQLLELPVREDIEEFESARSAEVVAENLVTVVVDNAFDRKDLDLALAVAMGVTSSGAYAPVKASPAAIKFQWVKERHEKLSFSRFLSGKQS